MRRAIRVRPAGGWPRAAERTTVTLVFDDRHRRRMRLLDDTGQPFLLDLDRPARLADGDGLELEDGGVIRVTAAPEPVADIAAGDPIAALKLAWHIGNRHALVQILGPLTLRIRDDPVLVSMLEGLGARITRRRAPFAPEPGAYAGHDTER
jgi:urease accessory protein